MPEEPDATTASTPEPATTAAPRKLKLTAQSVTMLLAAATTIVAAFAKFMDKLDDVTIPLDSKYINGALLVGVGFIIALSLKSYLDLRRKLTRAEARASEHRQHRRQALEVQEKLRTIADELRQLKKNSIRMLRQDQYASTVARLVEEHGDGHLLLFNIELNSFSDDAVFEGFWRGLSAMPGVKRVHLCLPPEKFARWKRIVTGTRAEFFGQPGNKDKFVACMYDDFQYGEEDRIAFALFDPVEVKDPAHHDHDWGALFLLNRPFVSIRNDGSFNYLHILEYNGDQDVLDKCQNLWDTLFDEGWGETAGQIQLFETWQTRPPTITRLLESHQCDEPRAARIEAIVRPNRFVDDTQKSPRPGELLHAPADERDRRHFRLNYSRDQGIAGAPEAITGFVSGLPSRADDATIEKKPCVIWASGFGDGQRPRLAAALSREMKEKDFIEVFFNKSGKLVDTTCTRLYEDIREIVDYVAQVPGVDTDRICIVGISLSGYLATKLARRNEKIRSLVLVAPPFDVVEMLDNFRRHYLHGKAGMRRIPTVDDFLKARQNLRVADWDMSRTLCNYFNHTVTCSHLVDIVCKGVHRFGRQEFMDSLAEITQSGRRVAIIYGKDDPIVDAPRNIERLRKDISAGKIDKGLLEVRSIPIAHYYPRRVDGAEFTGPDGSSDTGGRYPLVQPHQPKDLAQAVRDLARVIAGALGKITVLPEEEADTGVAHREDAPEIEVSDQPIRFPRMTS